MIRNTIPIFFIIFSKIILANSIAVINLDEIIDNNKDYKDILTLFNEYQKVYENEFKLQEQNLMKQLNQIESDKLIYEKKSLKLKIIIMLIISKKLKNLILTIKSNSIN